MINGQEHEESVVGSEIMTIEDVAEYLRVSPRTVYDWAQKHMIPCGKLGTTWRFKRSVIERWVDSKLSPSGGVLLSAPTGIRDILAPERVLLTDYRTKRECLWGLIDVLAQCPEVTDREDVVEGIFQRENIMSTGLGFGLAVPHLRADSISNLVVALAVNKSVIEDYEILDNTPVRIVCMLLARWDQHKVYLGALAVLTAKFRQEGVRNAILQAGDPETIYKILTED